MSLLLACLADQAELPRAGVSPRDSAGVSPSGYSPNGYSPSGTAVERFAAAYDSGALPIAGLVRDLLPASPPGPGQQYAFDVDLDSCTGCKSCVTACRSLNGLDPDESFRRVGLLFGEGGRALQHVTSACHHCVEPACLTGCPAAAYDKDPVTGIVRHLDDQCIGCGYCVFTCPYEIPRYNERLGIVRKCDMCSGRLAVGDAPACVDACPNGAISVTVVDTVTTVAEGSLPGATIVPGAPSSGFTLPTSTYRSARGLPDAMEASDRHALAPAATHPPLATMLVFTQLAVGTWMAAAVLGVPAAKLVAAGSGILALLASLGHLGRPLQAWRAVLGFRRSWLSREIIAFSAFGPLAIVAALTDGEGGLVGTVGSWAGPGASLAGAAGVTCSVLVYTVTGRQPWSLLRTALRFATTTLVTGLAVVSAARWTAQWARSDGGSFPARGVALALAAAMVLRLVVEVGSARAAEGRDDDMGRSARLLTGVLASFGQWRIALGVAGGVLVPLLLVATAPGDTMGAALAVSGLALVVAGELLERNLFFTACPAPTGTQRA